MPFVLGIALFGFAALVKADFGRRAAEEAMAAEGRVAAIVAADAYPVTVAASDGSCAVAVSVRSCLADEASARAAGQVAWKNATPDARRTCEPSLRVREARASALLDCLDGGR